MTTTIFASLLLAASFLGQAESLDLARGTAAERLEYMRKAVEPLRFTLDGKDNALRLLGEPVFRMGKQAADTVEEGAIFLWTDDAGRPQSTIQIFKVRDSNYPQGAWFREFVSLSPSAFTAEEHGRAIWAPAEPGVTLRPIPRAPRPADAPAQRLRQMQALANEFRASDYFKNTTWTELRLLPKPISRFGKAESKVLDGALFAFVTGTDPEVFLFVEARETRDGPQWQYAFAPMTCFAVKGSLAGELVWRLPYRGYSSGEKSKAYHLAQYSGR